MSKRKLIIMLFILALFSSAFCLRSYKAKHAEIGEEFSLKINETAEIEDKALSITFKDVLADSRCPVNVRCFWSGIARISIIAKKGEKSSELELTLYHDDEKRFNSYKIKFVELKPARIAGREINKEEYEASFVVLKSVSLSGSQQP